MSAHVESHESHETPMSLYYAVYGILMGLLVLTVVVAYFHLGAWALPVAMSIAIVKAGLVVVYFMHMRHTGKLMWLYDAIGLTWLGVLILAVLIDVYARGR